MYSESFLLELARTMRSVYKMQCCIGRVSAATTISATPKSTTAEGIQNEEEEEEDLEDSN